MKTLIALISIASAAFAYATTLDDACCAGGAKVAKAAVKTEVKAEAKKDACCKSTEAKKIAKKGAGCCNEQGQMAKFKVYAGGKYFFFGCAGSADKGRAALMAKHLDVSAVQAVKGKVRM